MQASIRQRLVDAHIYGTTLAGRSGLVLDLGITTHGVAVRIGNGRPEGFTQRLVTWNDIEFAQTNTLLSTVVEAIQELGVG